MIFRIHYVLFNAGLSAITIMLTVFLSRYSDASPLEIGTLLMALPFLCVITKPVFCALADRHQAHLGYFVASLAVMLLGFGSFAILPFFPDFVEKQGRASWYILVVLTIIGYNAYGVVWSLGDAFVVNKCYKRNQKFGMYRLWGTMSWGVFGLAIGQMDRITFLPDYVPGLLVMIIANAIDIIVLLTWPHKDDFIMGDPPQDNKIDNYMEGATVAHMPETMIGSLRLSQKAVATLANMVVEDINSTLSSMKSNNKTKTRTRVDQDLEKCPTTGFSFQQPIKSNQASNNGSPLAGHKQQVHDTNISVGSRTSGKNRYPLYRQLSTVNYKPENLDQDTLPSRSLMTIESGKQGDKSITTVNKHDTELHEDKEDLQLVILKMIMTNDREFLRYIIIFTLFGAMFNVHISFFFLHLEQLTQKDGIFPQLVGLCTVAQSIAETTCFAISPWVVSKLGRDVSIIMCTMLFMFRFFFNGLLFSNLNPYVCILIEPCHGIAYGIAYYIITDLCLHFTLQVDEFIPQLRARNLIGMGVDVNGVKNSVRATMQGIFSGAFDGLGNGLGALLAGLVLEHNTYPYLWCLCGILTAICGGLHQIFMIVTYLKGRGNNLQKDMLTADKH